MIRKIFISGLCALSAMCLALPAVANPVAPTKPQPAKAHDTLMRGTIIQASDITDGVNADDVIGKEVRRTIYAGQPIRPTSIGEPILVKRNSRVKMIYRSGLLELTAFGRAVEEGGLGDVVTVMNSESRKRVQGVVIKSGHVEVVL